MAFQKKKTGNDAIIINPPKFEIVRVPICGTTNLVMNNFSDEAMNMMIADQERGQVDKPAKSKKPPKDFDKGYRGSMHVSTEGWHGIPVIALRSAMIRAASLVGIEMTKAKMCVFVECDGFEESGKGLVRITKGEPEPFDAPVRNDNGSIDIRRRARFAPGWEAVPVLKYDAEFMSKQSVINLLHRAGICVGICAGRPFSTKSAGQGWGQFEIIDSSRKAAE